ncbi:MAG: amino acid-binding protein [Planctomycetota bacterium]|nr:MAG: amino acid-binding protein [Planctomycetota bacterium]
MIRKQLSFFLANKPGTWVRIGKAFKEGGVNILALTVSDTVDHAVVRLIVDDPQKALEILEERGLIVLEGEVLEIHLPNSPGKFLEIAEKCAAAGINIDYVYGSLPSQESREGTLYLHVSDLEKAQQVLS